MELLSDADGRVDVFFCVLEADLGVCFGVCTAVFAGCANGDSSEVGIYPAVGAVDLAETPGAHVVFFLLVALCEVVGVWFYLVFVPFDVEGLLL